MDAPDVTNLAELTTWVIGALIFVVATEAYVIKVLYMKLMANKDAMEQIIGETKGMLGCVSERIRVGNDLNVEIKTVMEHCKTLHEKEGDCT